MAPPAAVGALRRVFEAHPDAGIAGPVVVTAAQPGRIESAGIRFSTQTGRMRLVSAGRPVSEAPVGIAEVDAMTGAFMLLRRSVLEKVGLFDEEYFFGFEDLDLCLRARAAGFSVLCAGGVQVVHAGAGTIGARSARRVYFATRNHLRLAERARPLAAPWQALRAGCIVGLNLAHVLLTSPAPIGGALHAFSRGVWHHLLRRYGADDRWH